MHHTGGPSAIVSILGNRTAVHNRGVGRLSVAMAETSPEISLRSGLEIVGPIGDSPLTLCPSLSISVFFGELNYFRLEAFPFSRGLARELSETPVSRSCKVCRYHSQGKGGGHRGLHSPAAARLWEL